MTSLLLTLSQLEPPVEAAASHGAVPFMVVLTIFVLAVFIGFEIITKVPPTLHTPLMSGSNAISGITIVGAIIALEAMDAYGVHNYLRTTFGFIAIVMATVNVVGGYLVTHRMLRMFKKK